MSVFLSSPLKWTGHVTRSFHGAAGWRKKLFQAGHAVDAKPRERGKVKKNGAAENWCVCNFSAVFWRIFAGTPSVWLVLVHSSFPHIFPSRNLAFTPATLDSWPPLSAPKDIVWAGMMYETSSALVKLKNRGVDLQSLPPISNTSKQNHGLILGFTMIYNDLHIFVTI